MTRYFTKSAVIVTPDPADAFDDMDCKPNETTRDVWETDYETWTGLLDARGNEIHRSEKIPLGFAISRVKP